MTKQFYYPIDTVTGEVPQVAIEALKRGGVVHVPSNSLQVTPLLAKSDFAVIAKVDLSGTEYIADFRGDTIYSTEDAAQSKLVTELGDIDEGWTLKEQLPFSVWENDQWVQQLALLQQSKNTQVNAWRNNEEARLNQVIIAEGIEWDAHPVARKRIADTLQSSFTPPFWTDAHNVDQIITRETLTAMHTAIVQLGFSMHARQREMKTEIAMLTTCEAVNNYPIGWPASSH